MIGSRAALVPAATAFVAVAVATTPMAAAEPVVAAASSPSYDLSGYLIAAPFVWRPPRFAAGRNATRFDLQLLGRQNVRWFPKQNWTVAAELREDLFSGKSARELRDLGRLFSLRRQYLDLQVSLVDRQSVTATAELDRVWIDAYFGDVEATLGRQRIAWGPALAWNPIDIFNPASPLDFADVEQPGTDALRVQWFFGPASQLDVAAAVRGEVGRGVAAARATINVFDYDLSALIGRREDGIVLGGSWAGSIHGGGFRGEILGVRADDGADSLAAWASLSGDYTFANGTYLLVEALLNSAGTTGPAGGLELVRALERGWLSPSRLSVFGEIAKDLHPLVRATLAGVSNPHDRSWYLSPIVAWSVATNVDLTVEAYLFGGATGTEFGDDGELVLARWRWSY